MSLPELAGFLTALAAFLAAIFAFTQWNSGNVTKILQANVDNLKAQLDSMDKDHDERLSQQRKDFEYERNTIATQMKELREALLERARAVRHLEIRLEDHSRHVSKLEILLTSHGIPVPAFVVTPNGAGGSLS